MTKLKTIFGKRFKSNHDKAADADLYIQRLRSSIIGEGMLPSTNISLMEYAIQNMPEEGIMMEIGSYAGLSTNVILHLLNKYQKKHEMYCVDAWIYEGYNDSKQEAVSACIDGRNDVLRTDYCNYIKNAFIQSLLLFQPNRLPFAFHMQSSSIFSHWQKNELTDLFGRKKLPGGQIAFAYIDGDHAYETSKNDYENVLQLSLPGGFILLDDTAKGLSFGSVQLAKEIQKDKRVNVISYQHNLLVRKK